MSDELKTIDLDDPAFSETTDYDPNQDQNLRMVPPELDLQKNAISYTIKLSIGANPKGDKMPYPRVTPKAGTKYLALAVKAQVLADGKPWDKAFVNYPYGMIGTLVFNNTSSAADLCRLLGHPMPIKLPHSEQIAYAQSLLSDNPTIPGYIEWSGYCGKCEKDIPSLTGESNWPEKTINGEYAGHEQTTHCPDCKVEVNVGARIRKLVAIKK